jgi:hypothetical protein
MVNFTKCVDATVTLLLSSEVMSIDKKKVGGGPRSRCCKNVLARKSFVLHLMVYVLSSIMYPLHI